LNLEIAKGEKVCISGVSGAGKTALLHVLGSVYTDFKGVLAYDDMPMGSLDIESLRYVIGDNFNQESLFSASLEENITVGREGISKEDIQNAISISGLSDMVMKLPSGLLTIMDPVNRNLPLSLIKRIFLARSIVHKPSLLLLDDLADLADLRDFKRLISYVTSKERTWTLVLVSNDPYIAASCERTVVMDNGKVLTSGTFQEIIAQPGIAQIFGKD
jgi:ABC-type bacteriocin/lantibiotic exporter with double-glycine peptidase domain